MTLFFPGHEPLRTGFNADATRPSIVSIYQRDKRGRLRLVRAVLPVAAIGTRTKKGGRHA